MKKKSFFTLGLLILAIISTGCASLVTSNKVISSSPETTDLTSTLLPNVALGCPLNSAFEHYTANNELGLLVNAPTQDNLDNLSLLDTYVHAPNREKILIIPKYDDSTISIHQVTLEGDQLVVKETLYTKEHTQENYGLLLETFRPEGIPLLKITISSQGQNADYYVSYNGKDGTPPIEILTSKVVSISSDKLIPADSLLISPLSQDDYLEGLHLISKQYVDINEDTHMESLELYSEASYNEEGELMLNDGQDWTLIVRKDDQIYPVFERSFIQLGQLEYRIYEEYSEEKIFHLLISRVQGAGLTMYDCYYDREQDGFVSQIVYQTTGNIGFLE